MFLILYFLNFTCTHKIVCFLLTVFFNHYLVKLKYSCKTLSVLSLHTYIHTLRFAIILLFSFIFQITSFNLRPNVFFFSFGSIYFSQVNTMTTHIKFFDTALQCMYQDLKTLPLAGFEPGGLLFCRRTRCHAARGQFFKTGLGINSRPDVSLRLRNSGAWGEFFKGVFALTLQTRAYAVSSRLRNCSIRLSWRLRASWCLRKSWRLH
jgi:hypothetical protein